MVCTGGTLIKSGAYLIFSFVRGGRASFTILIRFDLFHP